MKNKALKERWVEALESGKYEQGQQCLRFGDKFCCLGVLCDLVDPEGWEFPDNSLGRYTHRGQHGMPDTCLVKFFGDRVGFKELSRLNDGGSSFLEIADHIRKNL